MVSVVVLCDVLENTGCGAGSSNLCPFYSRCVLTAQRLTCDEQGEGRLQDSFSHLEYSVHANVFKRPRGYLYATETWKGRGKDRAALSCCPRSQGEEKKRKISRYSALPKKIISLVRKIILVVKKNDF